MSGAPGFQGPRGPPGVTGSAGPPGIKGDRVRMITENSQTKIQCILSNSLSC